MSQLHQSDHSFNSANKELQEKNTILQAVYLDSPNGLQILRAVRDAQQQVEDFEWVFGTKFIEDIIGKGTLAGKRFISTLGNHEDDDTFLIYKSVVETNSPARMERKYIIDGQENWYEITVTKYEDGLVIGTEDITLRKRSELEIQEQTHFIRSITEATPDILFVMNLDTKSFIYTNRAVQDILGYSESQVMEMEAPFFDIMYKEDIPFVYHHLQEMKKAMDGEIIEIEYRMWDADGSLKWFADRNAVFRRDGDGVPVEKIGISVDITKQKEAEGKIHALNKTLMAKNRELESLNSELKTFNNIAANDYKETLRTLYTNLEYIIKNDAATLSDAGKGNVRKAQTAIQKMKLLTDDIVAFSRIPTLDSSITTVNLNEILENVLVDLDDKIKESGAKINSGVLPVIQGFPMLLSLLFYHILDNALKFRDREEQPVISIAGTETGLHAFGTPNEMKFEITFTDNGIGFDPKQSEKIFSIFYRLHERNEYRGSGIGLAVCRKIMALHGGYISASSNPGDGTQIKCSFPAETE